MQSVNDKHRYTGDKKSSQPLTIKGQCMICGGAPMSNIVRDMAFVKIVELYFATIPGKDVKPDLCKDVDLCAKCFDKLVEFSETEEILQYFENFAALSKMQLLRQILESTHAGKPGEENETTWIRQEVKKSNVKYKLMDYTA